jgi:signal transduction histidine kinase
MASDGVGRPPAHLVLRFAAGVLAVSVLVGAGIVTFMVRAVTDRATDAARFHAVFTVRAVLEPALAGVDLRQPLDGTNLETLDRIVRERVLTDGRDVRVKIWAPDGTILYSDLRSLIGRSFPDEASELEEVVGGETLNGISELDDAENVGERGVADRLFQTYVPLRATPGGAPVAVAEVYQDYAVVQSDIDTLVRRLVPILVGGLLILFAVLLPIAYRASRTLRLQNDRLRDQADRMSALLEREQETVGRLRELDQRKSDFVSAASHELRTPLASMVGYLRSLRRPELAQDAPYRDEFLDAMEKQTRRLIRLIESLLTSARLESTEGATVRNASVDVARLVQDAANELRLLERCRIDVGADARVVVTDAERLRDVVIELLDNAAKYSPDGGPIDVVTSRRDGAFELAIRDHGLGIEPEQRERIFERFYQADQSTTRRFGGLGLGLHLVDGLVRELGGTIEVRSIPGAGSTFAVTLPLAPQAASAERIEGRSENAIASSSA